MAERCLWYRTGLSEESYAEPSTGRIVGSVREEGAIAVAVAFHAHIGSYLHVNQAKSAVERAVATPTPEGTV